MDLLKNWGNKTSKNEDHRFEIIFIYANEKVIHEIIESISQYSNHFTKIHFQFIQAKELDYSTISNNTTLIFLEANLEAFFNIFQKLDPSISECKIVSNQINSDLYKLLPSADFLGFQRHLVDQDILFKLEENSFGSKSLGQIKKNISILEPILRTTFGLHLELDSIKHSEINYNECLPTGLTSEEICQIFRYLGSSYNIKLVSINLTRAQISNKCILQLISMGIWYFLEGLTFRVFENAMTSSQFQDFIVNIKDIEEEIIFSLNTEDGKWWVKLSESDSTLYPCSQEDYDLASQGFLSDRLMKRLFF